MTTVASWILSGRTCFGESTADEWLVVYLLREISQKFPDAWVRVYDNDGEFLLIEAADVLPEWLTADFDDKNRVCLCKVSKGRVTHLADHIQVWVNKGKVLIIPPSGDDAQELELPAALKSLAHNAQNLFHSLKIDEEAFHAIKKFPAAISDNFHHSLVTIPRRVAHLLHQNAALISIGVEFLDPRDLAALRPLQQLKSHSLFLVPEDFVDCSVKFTRLGYSRLRSEHFDPPISWKAKVPKSASAIEAAKVEMGMKISCGLEMFLQSKQKQNTPAYREMKLLLDDLNNGDDHLPTNEEILAWGARNDDESWINVKLEDLDDLLGSRQKSDARSTQSRSDVGGGAFQENIRHRFQKFTSFTNDHEMDFDSDNSDEESQDSDAEVELDAAQFERTMREVLGLNTEQAASTLDTKARENEGFQYGNQEYDAESRELQELEKAMEAEFFGIEFENQSLPIANEPKSQTATGVVLEISRTDESQDFRDASSDSDDVDVDFGRVQKMMEALNKQSNNLDV